MSRPWIVRTAWLALTGIALAIHVLALNSFVGRAPNADAVWIGVIGLFVAVVFTSAGGLLIWHRPHDRMAQFAAFALVLFGSVTFSTQRPSFNDAYPSLVLTFAVLDVLGRAAFTAFIFVFPDGHFVPRWVAWVALAWIAIQVPVPFLWLDAVKPVSPVIDMLTGPLFIAGLVAAAASQVYRYRRVSTPTQRQQTKWTAFGFAVALSVFLVANLVMLTVPGANAGLPALTIETISDGAIALIPVSIAIALVRDRLFDVDVLISRALAYAALTACTIGVYMLVVGYLSSLFRTQDNLLIGLLGTGAVAAIFQPLRERLQRGVNRLLYGQRDEPYVVLSDLGRRLDASADRATMLPVLVQTVVVALKIPYAAIRFGQDGQLVNGAVVGALQGLPVRLPLVHHGQQVGELVLGRRGGSEPFSAADGRLLDDLARQAAATLYAMQLNIDLQRSRERLVMAREEERRRLRRDLHDGLGPTLAALGLKLETARNRLGHDAEADALLAELAGRAQSAVSDIRRLVYGLRPPALDDLGLVGALRQLANTADLPLNAAVEVFPTPLVSMSAAIEVAAYRIAQEAFTNVVRHARATHCTIRLEAVDGALQLSVEDDGVGFREREQRGVGLGSMRERAEELGGTFSITPRSSGGTRIDVVLPLVDAEAVA